MDFYEAQDQAHQKTRKLGFLFALSVIIVMVCVGLLSVILFSSVTSYLKISEGALNWGGIPWEAELRF